MKIVSDGTPYGTRVFVNDKQLDNIVSLVLKANVVDGLQAEIEILAPEVVMNDVDGDMVTYINEQKYKLVHMENKDV